MAAIEATTDNFNELIEGNDMVLIDFWAPWCGPCPSFAPTFEAASDSHPDIVFAKVNTEEQQELAAAFNIRSIPTLMAFRDQIVLYAQPGAMPASGLEQPRVRSCCLKAFVRRCGAAVGHRTPQATGPHAAK